FQNAGVTYDKPPTVQDVAARWDEITDLSAAKQADFKLG
ncbi:serine/threonine protein kinase, partial [Mycobacterium avium]|nr:serine/threonine protein kinase [Mycobacterium avium]MCA2286981.1 serine/threonine protein kinase [Mycobacterium avium]MCA2301923.1 serine/threonine protein kinase [Mycobacterium avium]